MLAGLSWIDEDALTWTPDLVGSICFLTASYFMIPELFDADATAPKPSVASGNSKP
ncbi:MAG: hypothetical protein WBG92_05745 [Thiohalocapsa sp.]